MIVRKSTQILFLTILIIATILSITLGIYFGSKNKQSQPTENTYTGGIVTNGYECAQIGSDIINKGGSAVDAAIAALFCEGIAMPQSMGLGGGFLMTIYTKETGKAVALNAREVAPLAAHTDMFGGNASLALKGGLSIAVPGELKGYWEAHQKYGKLEWGELVRPSVDLCREGHLVTAFLAGFFESRKSQIMASESLREVFVNPATNDTYKEGDYVKRPQLAETLETIAVEGADALYNGSLTEKFVNDINENGGIITVQDLNNYQVEWLETVTVKLSDDNTLHTFPIPGSGVILAFILNTLKNFVDRTELTRVTNWQRIVETFKYGYGKRTELGDQNFVNITDLLANLTSETFAETIRNDIQDTKTYQNPEHYGANVTITEDYGTAHISILAPNGDAVSVTSTIVQYFGSDIRSKSTGIILNDEMDNFSSPNITNEFGLPPSPANYIEPGKRPMSSMCPSIILDKNGDVQMVIGGAGGTKIITSIALVIMRHMWFNETLQEAVNAKRLHHQLFPMTVQYEYGFSEEIVEALQEIGHNYTIASENSGFSALIALSRSNTTIIGAWDPRRSGIYLWMSVPGTCSLWSAALTAQRNVGGLNTKMLGYNGQCRYNQPPLYI